MRNTIVAVLFSGLCVLSVSGQAWATDQNPPTDQPTTQNSSIPYSGYTVPESYYESLKQQPQSTSQQTVSNTESANTQVEVADKGKTKKNKKTEKGNADLSANDVQPAVAQTNLSGAETTTAPTPATPPDLVVPSSTQTTGSVTNSTQPTADNQTPIVIAAAPAPALTQASSSSTPPLAADYQANVPVVSGADLVEVQAGKSKKTTYSASYLATELGRLRADIDAMKTGASAGKTVGYDGGFFIKSDDAKFVFKINATIKGKYAFNLAEDVDNAHSFLMSAPVITFSGNALSEKAKYVFVVNTGASPPIYGVDWWYEFASAFNLHFMYDGPPMSITATTSGSKLSFVSRALPALRFDYTSSIQLAATGQIKWFSYFLAVNNGIGTELTVNANNELAYTARFDFNILGEGYGPGEGDLAHSEKPNFTVGVAGFFGHDETGTQARIMSGAFDTQFFYKGFAFSTSAFYRQTDPDQFTRSQTDIGLTAQTSYFAVPKRLELAVRGSALFDDLTDAYLNTNTAMGAANFSGLKGVWAGGDIAGDSANEYEGSFCVSYYFLPKYNVKAQAQYTMMLDGVNGADDLLNHIGILYVMMGF